MECWDERFRYRSDACERFIDYVCGRFIDYIGADRNGRERLVSPSPITNVHFFKEMVGNSNTKQCAINMIWEVRWVIRASCF
jgi:hypothetical protein